MGYQAPLSAFKWRRKSEFRTHSGLGFGLTSSWRLDTFQSDWISGIEPNIPYCEALGSHHSRTGCSPLAVFGESKAHCKTSTYERYEQIFRIHLSPRFGSRPIDRIDRDHLKRYFSELATSKKHGLGTLRNIVATLRAILSEAVEDRLIDGNPASRLGKYAFGNARKRDIDFLTRSEAENLLTAAKIHSPTCYPMFLAALRTGLREDVQFGENADDPNRFILVRRNYSRGEFTTPKNHKSAG